MRNTDIRIKDMKIKIKFLQDAVFTESPSIAIYKSVCSFIRRIVCICPDVRCSGCSRNGKCIYSFLTGADFSDFRDIPFIVSYDPSLKREFKSEEIHEYYFTLIGDAVEFVDFIIFSLKEYEQRGLFGGKCFFKIISLEINNNLNPISSFIDGINILTPVVFKNDILENQYGRIKYLNDKFHIFCSDIEYIKPSYELKLYHKLSHEQRFGESIIADNGFIAEIKFNDGIALDDVLKLSEITGFGNFNFFNGRNAVYIERDE
ncbi:MAG: hypothetical protein GX209_09915 [Epulopiscium sp.]|jgi:hypothetical protein|nr:hypothetical protein [Candidatus Epulonipiscium sp.]